MEPPGCPPDAAVPVPGPLQPAREDVRGSGDRQRGPGGQRAGEAADPDVQPDLGPVVAGCLPDGRDQVAGGAADGADPLPFGRVPVPAGTRLGLGCGLVQRVGDGSVGSVGRPVAAGVPAAGGQPEDVPQVSECRLDVGEAVGGRGLARRAAAGSPRRPEREQEQGLAGPARPPGWRRSSPRASRMAAKARRMSLKSSSLAWPSAAAPLRSLIASSTRSSSSVSEAPSPGRAAVWLPEESRPVSRWPAVSGGAGAGAAAGACGAAAGSAEAGDPDSAVESAAGGIVSSWVRSWASGWLARALVSGAGVSASGAGTASDGAPAVSAAARSGRASAGWPVSAAASCPGNSGRSERAGAGMTLTTGPGRPARGRVRVIGPAGSEPVGSVRRPVISTAASVWRGGAATRNGWNL